MQFILNILNELKYNLKVDLLAKMFLEFVGFYTQLHIHFCLNLSHNLQIPGFPIKVNIILSK